MSAFLEFYFTAVKGLDLANPVHPTNVLTQIVEQYGRSRALEGLRQEVNDTLEELAHRQANFVPSLDALLRQQGIVTISELRRRYSSSFKRIVKRGRVRTNTEDHVVNAIVVDQANEVTDLERTALQRLLDAYEQMPSPTL